MNMTIKIKCCSYSEILRWKAYVKYATESENLKLSHDKVFKQVLTPLTFVMLFKILLLKINIHKYDFKHRNNWNHVIIFLAIVDICNVW